MAAPPLLLAVSYPVEYILMQNIRKQIFSRRFKPISDSAGQGGCQHRIPACALICQHKEGRAVCQEERRQGGTYVREILERSRSYAVAKNLVKWRNE
jgi:hypothetical protein